MLKATDKVADLKIQLHICTALSFQMVRPAWGWVEVDAVSFIGHSTRFHASKACEKEYPVPKSIVNSDTLAINCARNY